jgi:eukaryotic-like serine/threonine-protein kinase
MEFVDGVTLRRKVPVQAIETGVGFAVQSAEALAEAYAKGMVHRDIKPDNIMVDAGSQIKVMDIGLPRFRNAARLTRASTAVGTLACLAPELLQGAEADARSDLFSLGAELYETLTSALPFCGEHEAALVHEILNADPKPLDAFRPDVPPSLQSLVRDLLQKDPRQRIPTASVLIQRPQTLSSGTPTSRLPEKNIAVRRFHSQRPRNPAQVLYCGFV